MDHNSRFPINKRALFIIVGLSDVLIGALILLVYFGFLPVDISTWGIPRWIFGLVGAVWFMAALAFVTYQVTKTDASE